MNNQYWNIRTGWVLVLCIVFSKTSFGSHIVGGEATYKFVEFSNDNTQVTYDIMFTIYRDQNGIAFDAVSDFGIYKLGDDGIWFSYDVISAVSIQEITEIYAPADPCRDQLLSEEKIEKGIFVFRVTLDIIDSYYKITYQKCCRNHTINNIMDPGLTGAVYDIKISPTAQAEGNSSPTFMSLPPTFLCTNSMVNYDHSAIDIDGDSLVYKFCTPYIAGGGAASDPMCCDCQNPVSEFCPPPFESVSYVSPYSSQIPLGGDPVVGIHPTTGIISGVPNIGGAFVVAVCVEEYRNGTLISEIRRDFEFNVVPCTSSLEAALIAEDSSTINDTKIYLYESCLNETFEILNGSHHADMIGNYFWTIKNGDNITTHEYFGVDERDVLLQFKKPGFFEGMMIIDHLTICSDTARFMIEVHEGIHPQFEFEYDICEEGPVKFKNISDQFQHHSDIDWSWQFPNDSVSFLYHPEYQFITSGEYDVTLTAMDSYNCTYETTKTVDYHPIETQEDPILFSSDTLICNGDSIWFYDQWIADEGIYDYTVLSIINGCDSIRYELELNVSAYPIMVEIDTTICIDEEVFFGGKMVNEEGYYFETIPSINQACDSLEKTLFVQISDNPIIESVPDLEVGVGMGMHIPLSIESEWSEITWYPEYGLSCANCIDPIVTLDEDQSYVVKVTNKYGCESELNVNLAVTNNINFYTPNIISTSDRDEKNHCFYVQSRDDMRYSYTMNIFDRYGNPIFQKSGLTCNESGQGWRPKNLNPGVFVYTIIFDENIEPKKLAGTITLIE